MSLVNLMTVPGCPECMLVNLNFFDSVKKDFKKAEPTLKTIGKVAVGAGQACLAVGCEDLLAAAALQNLNNEVKGSLFNMGDIDNKASGVMGFGKVGANKVNIGAVDTDGTIIFTLI